MIEMRNGIEIFARIHAEFVNGTANYMVAKTYLSDFDIHFLYAAFLLNEISVANPYAVEGYDFRLSFFDHKE